MEPNSPDFLGSTAEQISFIEEIPARKALFSDEPIELPEKLRVLLPEKLYLHQSEAICCARNGEDVLVATGTNSGKSLCFMAPALAACLEEPMARAMFLYPTKALAQDQLVRINELASPLGLNAATYDGDTPKSRRKQIRNLAHIILTNPDMLHSAILPTQEHWSKFLKALRVIALDELHVYRGVFGSHVALVLRRLLRLCAHYGNRPQIIAGSATIGNPEELFEKLIGRKATTINLDGSPSGRRTVVFMNPPVLPSGNRLSSNATCSEALSTLIENHVSTLAFSRSRVGAELILRYSRQRLSEDQKHKVESYRAGYTPKERRQIEASLKKGELVGLSATNALELGIDVGNLDAVIINTYPGSVASFWQQAGRAGRGTRDGVAIFIAGDNPLEQYLLEHPERILNSKSETVTVQPSNPNILSSHLLCAAHERPLSPSETEIFGESALELAESLERAGELQFRSGHFFYPSFEPPAFRVSIRGSTQDTVRLLVGGEEIGTMEYFRALAQAHPGAIYLHRGEPFEVESLDIHHKTAELSRFSGNYYTQSRSQSLLEPGNPFLEKGPVSVSGCRVTTTVNAFSKKSYENDTVIEVIDLELPSITFETVCLRVDLPTLNLEADLASQIAGVHGVEHALLALAPLFAGCDRNDIGSSWYSFFPETGAPAIFLYDQAPGGIGLSESLFKRIEELSFAALERIRRCSCSNGCPSCLYLPQCEVGNEQLLKPEALRLLRWIREHLANS